MSIFNREKEKQREREKKQTSTQSRMNTVRMEMDKKNIFRKLIELYCMTKGNASECFHIEVTSSTRYFVCQPIFLL